MTASRSLSAQERRALLQDLTSLKTDDDDAVAQDPKWFLPLDTHARALRLETLVVRGGRGSGKSSLFHFLGHLQKDPTLGANVGMPSVGHVAWIEGFSTAKSHPSSHVLGQFAETAGENQQRLFWFGWLCSRIADAISTPLPAQLRNALQSQNPPKIADAAQTHLTTLSAWLDDVERSSDTPLVITYDNLDRVVTSSTTRKQFTASLLAMWLALADRYQRVRPKVFVREDLFTASLSAFPDASKLEARSVSIEWRVEDLYRVLIKHMANLSEQVRDWIQGSSRGIPLSEEGGLGWMPPRSLSETGKRSRKGFVDHLAGETMGTGAKKGLTYRWIPNRLQDAHERVVPRSILSLVRHAATFALERGPKAQSLRLLHPQELQGALERTSERRATELQEEFPVVARLQHLRGRSVMLGRKETIQSLARPTDVADEFGNDGEQVLRTLIDLGVMSIRTDGRIDVPDIYRYGFGILRKGGVKRPR